MSLFEEIQTDRKQRSEACRTRHYSIGPLHRFSRRPHSISELRRCTKDHSGRPYFQWDESTTIEFYTKNHAIQQQASFSSKHHQLSLQLRTHHRLVILHMMIVSETATGISQAAKSLLSLPEDSVNVIEVSVGLLDGLQLQSDCIGAIAHCGSILHLKPFWELDTYTLTRNEVSTLFGSEINNLRLRLEGIRFDDGGVWMGRCLSETNQIGLANHRLELLEFGTGMPHFGMGSIEIQQQFLVRSRDSVMRLKCNLKNVLGDDDSCSSFARNDGSFGDWFIQAIRDGQCPKELVLKSTLPIHDRLFPKLWNALKSPDCGVEYWDLNSSQQKQSRWKPRTIGPIIADALRSNTSIHTLVLDNPMGIPAEEWGKIAQTLINKRNNIPIFRTLALRHLREDLHKSPKFVSSLMHLLYENRKVHVTAQFSSVEQQQYWEQTVEPVSSMNRFLKSSRSLAYEPTNKRFLRFRQALIHNCGRQSKGSIERAGVLLSEHSDLLMHLLERALSSGVTVQQTQGQATATNMRELLPPMKLKAAVENLTSGESCALTLLSSKAASSSIPEHALFQDVARKSCTARLAWWFGVGIAGIIIARCYSNSS